MEEGPTPPAVAPPPGVSRRAPVGGFSSIGEGGAEARGQVPGHRECDNRWPARWRSPGPSAESGRPPSAFHSPPPNKPSDQASVGLAEPGADLCGE